MDDLTIYQRSLETGHAPPALTIVCSDLVTREVPECRIHDPVIEMLVTILSTKQPAGQVMAATDADAWKESEKLFKHLEEDLQEAQHFGNFTRAEMTPPEVTKVTEEGFNYDELNFTIDASNHHFQRSHRDLVHASIQIDQQTVELEKLRDDLRRNDLLDPEINYALSSVISASIEIRNSLAHVAEGKGQEYDVWHFNRGLSEWDSAYGIVQNQIVPNGPKWWRYRYEYSFFESLFLVFFLAIMGVISRGYRGLHTVTEEIGGVKNPIEADTSSVYAIYRGCFGRMMLQFSSITVCGFVWWVLDRLRFWNFVNSNMPNTGTWHVPSDVKQLQLIAANCGPMLLVSLLVYFGFMYLTIFKSTNKIQAWRDLANGKARKASFSRTITATNLSDDAESNLAQFATLQKYFIHQMEVMDRDPTMTNKHFGNVTSDPLWREFNFSLYLDLSVRNVLSHLVTLRSSTFIALTITYALFTLGHYFLHLSYLLIFSCMFGISIVLFIFMHQFIVTHKYLVAQDILETSRGQEAHATNRGMFWIRSLQFVLFFICYGFARIVLGWFMWQLYFWPTLLLSFAFVAFAIFYAFWFAEAIPVFAAVMAIPPYISEDNQLEDTFERMRAEKEGDMSLTPR